MAKPRVPRTRGDGTLTEAAYWGKIRGALRAGSLKYASRYAALAKAKHPKPKATLGRHRVEFFCAACKGSFEGKNVEVDHIERAGSLRCYEDLAGFVERLYCESSGLQVLCKPCHKLKTAQDREDAKNETGQT